MTTLTASQNTRPRRFRGLVIRAVLEKTITVRVERRFRHSRLGRVMRSTRKFLVHDARGSAHEGDTVLIEETRPLSKLKRWRLVDVLAKKESSTEEQETETPQE